jgi:hypothetical protein
MKASGRHTGGPNAAVSWILQDALARIVWIREEFEPAVRDQALEDLEVDLAAWLAESTASKTWQEREAA